MTGKSSAIVGIECGATSSRAIIQFSDNTNKIVKLGPANFKLLTKELLQKYFLNFQNVIQEYGVDTLSKIAVGMPGILIENDKQVVNKIIRSIWPNLETVWVGNDLETALACLQAGDHLVKFIIISGTGSCCYGTNGKITTKVGGYGHIIGDNGSGYSIAHNGLRAALREYEHNNESSFLLDSLINALKLNTLEELVTMITSPDFTKANMASLVPVILDAWNTGDTVATSVVNNAIQDLVDDAICLTNKLLTARAQTILNIKIGLTGSILTENLRFQSEFILRLKQNLVNIIPGLKIDIEELRHTYRGALKMISPEDNIEIEKLKNNYDFDHVNESESELKKLILPIPTALSPTECRNPKSTGLDKMSISDAIDLWLEEEKSFYQEISKQKLVLEKIIKQVTNVFQNNGRLFYVGAGTSGRLGILDASECPPTFKSPPEWVQGIISGGTRAIQNSIEDAEDSITGGMQAIENRLVNSKDIVIGIASSGRTPFVWGALYKAKELGAFTTFLSCNPNMILKHKPDETIVVNVGPEILTGSTRLKCGSATKCILNMITTLSMVQYGKCLENLMVDLNPANQKLKERALRIVLAIVNSNKIEGQEGDSFNEMAQQILVKHDYNIKKTVHELQKTIDI